jgi:hypothetical protein
MRTHAVPRAASANGSTSNTVATIAKPIQASLGLLLASSMAGQF